MAGSAYSGPDDWTIFHLASDHNDKYSLKNALNPSASAPALFFDDAQPSPFKPRVLPRPRDPPIPRDGGSRSKTRSKKQASSKGSDSGKGSAKESGRVSSKGSRSEKRP